MPRLTKRVVEAAEPRAQQYTIWCSELPGFGLKVNTAGTRSYFLDYRARGGKRHRSVIGRHGATTADEARRRAIAMLAEVFSGDDPKEKRRQGRKALTVAELCDDYLLSAGKGLILGRGGLPKKASTLSIDRGRVEQHIKPLLGSRAVASLKKSDIAGFIRDITEGRTAKNGTSGRLRGRIRVTGGPGAAARASGLLGGILSFAVSEGIIDANPAAGVRRPTGSSRRRRLSPEEYALLGAALRKVEADPNNWQGPGMLRLAALTGFRIGEVEHLTRGEIDGNRQIVDLGDTKTGHSVRPLGISALELIESLPEVDSKFLFPAPRLKGRPYAGIKRFYRNIFASAGLDGVTPHVLRHSFASVAADLGFADSTIGACLGHTGRSMTSRYTHHLDSVIVAAADVISGQIAEALQRSPTSKAKE